MQDVRLANAIQSEMENYNGFLKTIHSTIHPVLLFTTDLGDIINKSIRYFAVIYDLAAFYIFINGTRMLVVCNKDYLNKQHYNPYKETINEDSELVDKSSLQMSVNRTVRNLKNDQVRTKLGLRVDNSVRKMADQIYQQHIDYLTDIFLRQRPTTSQTEADIFMDDDSSTSGSDEESSSSDTDLTSTTTSRSTESGIDNLWDIFESVRDNLPEEYRIFFEELLQKELDDSDQNDHVTAETSEMYEATVSAAVSRPIPIAPHTIVLIENNNAIVPVEMISSLNTSWEYYDYANALLEYVLDYPLILNPIEKYDPFDYIKSTNLSHVVEVFDIPATLTDDCLQCIYNVQPTRIVRCDNTHALLIMPTADNANKILKIQHEVCKTRSMLNASPVSTAVASLLDFVAIVESMLSSEN